MARDPIAQSSTGDGLSSYSWFAGADRPIPVPERGAAEFRRSQSLVAAMAKLSALGALVASRLGRFARRARDKVPVSAERTVAQLIRRPRGLVVAVPLIAGMWVLNSLLPARANLVPDLIYEIEAVSGYHKTSLVLGMGQPGVPQVPVPVDVNGNRIPDVLVSVNLVNIAGLYNNPPDIGQILAPNIVIDRFLNGVPIDKSPPLRINVKLTIPDVGGDFPKTIFRFGYDTGKADSIPPSFRAVVSGLETLFDPTASLGAIIDTRGTLIGSTGPRGYEGPLAPFFEILQGPKRTAIELAYKPFPQFVHATYRGVPHETGNEHHITYHHGTNVEPPGLPEIDLDTRLQSSEPGTSLDVKAHVERLPREFAVDYTEKKLGGKTIGGEVDFSSDVEGRPADAAIDAHTTETGEPPMFAKVLVEGIPENMAAEWSLPKGGDKKIFLDGKGGQIGAVDADVRFFEGTPRIIEPLIPEEEQFVDAQFATGADGSRWEYIAAHVAHIRKVDVDILADKSFVGHFDAGDGVQPLQAYLLMNQAAPTDAKVRLNTTVSPLPDVIDVAFDPGTKGSADHPLDISYTASESVDVDADAQVLLKGPQLKACGKTDMLCLDLEARHIPTTIAAKVWDVDKGVPGSGPGDELRVDVDTTPRVGGVKPDVFADAIVGPLSKPGPDQPSATEAPDPLVARAEARGLGKHLRVRTIQGEDDTPEKVEFFACEIPPPGPDSDGDWSASMCEDGTTEQIDSLAFSLTTFLDRPPNIKAPHAGTPNFADVQVRGDPDTPSGEEEVVELQAVGRIQDVSELVYLNKGGVFGVRSAAGGGGDLAAAVDIKDLDLKNDDPANGRLDANGRVVVSPLPKTLNFCFNQAGLPITAKTHDITQKCQEDYQIDGLGDTTPLSFAYDASNPFTASANAAVKFQGMDAEEVEDDRVIKGKATVTNVPSEVTAHFVLPPKDVVGPIKGRVTTSSGANQIGVDFAASVLDGGFACKDPRTPASTDDLALCMKGKLVDVPSSVNFGYDPTKSSDNLFVETSGSNAMDITDLDLSMVSRVEEATTCPSPPCPTIASRNVIIATGKILDLPEAVRGSLVLPKDEKDPPSVEIKAAKLVNGQLVNTSPLGSVDVSVRNFVAPDPLPDGPPNPRNGVTPNQTVTLFQRGEAFKAQAKIEKVSGFGYRVVRDADGNPLDTVALSVRFGDDDDVIRAYTDLQPDATKQILADIVLTDPGNGADVCFRGAKTVAAVPGPNEGTFCDGVGSNPVQVDADDGAIQIRRASSSGTGELLDVDAFLRLVGGGGSEVIAGVIDIDDIPAVVQGTFPSGANSGDLDMGGYALSGGTAGIGAVKAEIATFDIASDGYGTDRPYRQRLNADDVFKAAVPIGDQYAWAVLKNDDVNIKAKLTTSKFHRIRMDNDACPNPNDDLRTDYPAFPKDAVSRYTCIKAELHEDGTNDPLNLYLFKESPGDPNATDPQKKLPERMTLRDAGITDIPQWVQVTLSQTDTKEGADETFRRPCGPATVDTGDSPNCMAPLIRVDQPASNSRIFGSLELGAPEHVAKLPDVKPRNEKLADLDALPANYEAPDDNRVPFTCRDLSRGFDKSLRCGVRAKVALFRDVGTDRFDPNDDKVYSAVKAGLHLPVPQSLTVDQIQTWDDQDGKTGDASHWRANDLRFHLVAREVKTDPSTGVKSLEPVERLGELSALIEERLVSGGNEQQILVSKPCSKSRKERKTAGACDADYQRGVSIPGELGIEMYERNNLKERDVFRQIDGRGNGTLDLGVRITGVVLEEASVPDKLPLGRIEARVQDVPATDAANPGDPAWRLRIEMISKEPENSCQETFACLKATVAFQNIYADIDFKPPNASTTARRVDAVLNIGGALNQGLELRSYGNVAGTKNVPVKVVAFLDIDPLDIQMTYGIPVLGGLFLGLDSTMQVNFDINAHHFKFRHKTFHVDTVSEGGTSRFGPMDTDVHAFGGSAGALGWPLVNIFYVPTDEPLDLGMRDCSGGGLTSVETPWNAIDFDDRTSGVSTNSVSIPDGTTGKNFVIWPLDDGGIQMVVLLPDAYVFGLFSGLATAVVNLVRFTIPGAFCGDLGDISLMEDGRPADPVGTTVTKHPIPGVSDDPVDPVDPPTDPDPPAASSDYTVSASDSWCGSHVFDEFTVNSGISLDVATSADGTAIPGLAGTAKCPNGSQGALHIVARKIIVNGIITADGATRSTICCWSGNGGGTHIGKGGEGWDETNDVRGSFQPFGNETADPVTEAGIGNSLWSNPGARTTDEGAGGSVVSLRARDVVVGSSGSVGANGNDGGDELTTCGDPSGRGGEGGGSGGGIVISAEASFVNNGSVTASGGYGGSGSRGGGGGGGGGAVKVFTPRFSGHDPTVTGGGGGSHMNSSEAECADPKNGTAGGAGKVFFDPRATSQAHQPTAFWNRDTGTTNLAVPYSAAAGGTHNVFLCGQQRTAAKIAETAGGPVPSKFDKPTTDVNTPCGSTGVQLGALTGQTDDVTFDPAAANPKTISAGNRNMEDGYWGLWTVATRRIPQFPLVDIPERTPRQVDVVVGIDNTGPGAPTVSVPQEWMQFDANGDPLGTFLTNSKVAPLGIDANDALSGIATIECKFDAAAYVACEEGSNEWRFSSGNGTKTVTVRVTDEAGNQSERSLSGVLDTIGGDPPSITLSAPDGNEGWHIAAARTATLTHQELFGTEPPGFTMQYRIDDGEVHSCVVSATTCSVDQTALDALQPGAHTITAWEIDRAGNSSEQNAFGRTIAHLKIDTERPQSALLIGPDEPDGANGWYVTRPWIGFSGFDGPGGSGLANIRAKFAYGADEASVTDREIVDNPGPRQLEPGLHRICWTAKDLAGLEELPTEGSYAHCASFKVDDGAPSTTQEALSSPTNGWYTQDVTIKVGSADAAPGSGVRTDSDANLCGPTADATDTTPPSGVCVSIDDLAFKPYPFVDAVNNLVREFTLSEGIHQVRSFAVDQAGHRSPIETVRYDVDTSDPFVTYRVAPSQPARDGWYRMLPRVTIRANDGDQNAGIRVTRYSIDGDPILHTYDGPLTLPSGSHTVTYMAIDQAQRGGFNRPSFAIKSDVEPPVVRSSVRGVNPGSVTLSLGGSFQQNARLWWEVGDDLSGRIELQVVVYDQFGRAIRTLDGGTHTVPPRGGLAGYTEWDGSPAGLVSAGVYHYRVIAYDEAGNVALSGESRPLIVRASILGGSGSLL